MSVHNKELNSGIPDLGRLSLDRLADLDDTVLKQSIALYRRRLNEIGVPLNSFTASISEP